MAYIVSNHDFTHGEIDKTLFARSDLTFYNKAAATLENWVVLPGGAVRSRFGTQNTGLALPASADHFQMFPWKTADKHFLVIVGNVSANGISVIDIATSTITSFANPFSAASVEGKLVKSAQQQNEIILAAASAQPFQLTYSGGSVTGATFTFKNAPVYLYDNSYDANTFTLSDKAITPPSTLDSACPTLTISGTSSFAFSADFVGGTFTALGPTTSVQIGTATIVAYVSTTQVRVRIHTAFGELANIGTQVVVKETAYNTTRGWPECVTFYENRLIFAGGNSVPQSIFMSAISDYRDFSPGQALASDGIEYTIASGESDNIINIVSGRSLQVFTSTGESASPIWSNEGLTPQTVAVRRQTSNGSTSTTPVILDNSSLYVKRGGKAIMAYTYGADGQSYISTDVSVMSTHLINNPIDMSSYTINDAYDSNLLLMVNGDRDTNGGSLVTYQTLAEQNVSAWASTKTYEGKSTDSSSFDDYWNNVCVVEDDVYFITTRGSASQHFLEKMDWKVCMDSYETKVVSSTGVQTLSFASSTQFHGRTVQVITDVGTSSQRPEATFIGSFQMSASGDIIVDIPKTGTYYIGLGYEYNIKTMPAHITAETGDTLYTKKTISKVYVQYVDSYSFKINDVSVPVDNFSSSGSSGGIVLDQPAEPDDGIFMTPTIKRGWTRTAYAEIKMEYPLPCTILGISVVLTA
tara:strand:- start:3058 stop:5142 length:2085 start_codon:yes stop_codon:yes gene_type:complete